MPSLARTKSREDQAYFAKLMNSGKYADDPIGQSIGFRATIGGPRATLSDNTISQKVAESKNIPVYRALPLPNLKGPSLIDIEAENKTKDYCSTGGTNSTPRLTVKKRLSSNTQRR